MIRHEHACSGKMPGTRAWQFTVPLCALLFAGCTSQGILDSGDHAPPGMVDISGIKDAVPRHEPLSRYGNPASYVVYGKRYYTMPTSSGYSERGIASWYGTKFHGKRTSSGETYDMYQMTAAHKTLPLPTYVEVKNLRNGRTVVVKVNDRGPFMHDRIIDLSFVAAAKLGIQEHGTGLVEVHAIETATPQQTARAIPAAQTVPSPARQDHRARTATGSQAVAAGLPARPPLVAQPVPASTPAPAATPQAPPENRLPQAATVTPAAPAGQPQSRPAPDTNVYLQVGAYRVLKNAEHMALKLERLYIGSIRIAEVHGNKGTLYKVQVGPLESVAEARRVARDLLPHGIKDSQTVTR